MSVFIVVLAGVIVTTAFNEGQASKVACILAGVAAIITSAWAYGVGYAGIGTSMLFVGGVVAVVSGAFYSSGPGGPSSSPS